MNDISRNHREEQNQRIYLVGIIVVLAFVVLWIRLWSLQIVHGKSYKEKSTDTYIQTLRLTSPRGCIYDRNGILLAENVPSFNLMINREEAGRQLDITIRKLVQLLGIEEDDIQQNKKRWGWSPRPRPVLVKRDLSFEQVNIIEARKYQLPGVSIEVTFHRNYPMDESACHSIGYVGEATEKQIKENEYQPGDIVGKTGVEYSFNNLLIGMDGWEKVEVDAYGNVTRVLSEKPSVCGINIYLTLDILLQNRIKELFKDHVGSVIVMEPRTGEIRAMVINPGFNLNYFADGITPEQWKEIRANPNDPLINRAVSGRYSPGSVFKVVGMLAALEEHTADLSTHYECRGVTRLDGARKHCWKRGGHGVMYLQEALANSCNIFFYNIGSVLGIENIAKWSRNFGLGSKTGIRLPEEYSGLVPDMEWKRRTFPKDPTWWPGETLSVAIGQGSLIVTPIQVACLISSIANNGEYFRPRILKKIVDPQTYKIQEMGPELVKIIRIDKNNLDILKTSMEKVVNEGTARGCKPPWVYVAGKTGTVQIISKKFSDGNDEMEEMLQDHAWLATYGGLYPDYPELTVLVFIEHGGREGAVAKIKIVRQIYEYCFPEPAPEPEPEQNIME